LRVWLAELPAVAAALALVTLSASAVADDVYPNRPVADAVFTETAPQIDGLPGEPAWQAGTHFTKFRLREPTPGGSPKQRTEVRLLYDADYLYVAFWAYDDEPEKIVAKEMTRDSSLIRTQDRVGVVLDPLMSRRNGYFFAVTPLGTRFDALSENGQTIRDWDGIWDAACHINDAGFTCELAIPFKTLNIDPQQSTWGFDIARTVARNGEWSIWANRFQDVPINTLSHVGRLHGVEGIDQGMGLDLRLNLAARYRNDGERRTFAGAIDGTGTQIDNGRAFSDVAPGFDAFYRLTPSLSLSATANTDFSDTEDDTRQVNQSRFALFFPEKRRFFLQDFGVFDFGDIGSNPDSDRAHLTQNAQPFFSRTIGLAEQRVIAPNGQPMIERVPVDIVGGVKVSGRVGRMNVGLLSVKTAEQRVFEEVFAADGRRLRQVREIEAATLSVARVSLNILEESNLGLVFTHGDPSRSKTFRGGVLQQPTRTGGRESTLFGLDLNLISKKLVPNRTTFGRLWVQRSDNPSGLVPDDDSDARKFAWGARVEYPNDRFNWELGVRQVGASFRPALGFVNQQGTRRYDGRFRYRYRPADERVKWVESDFDFFWTEELSGNLLESTINLYPVRIETPQRDIFELRYQLATTRFDVPFRVLGVNIPRARATREHRFTVDFKSSETRVLSVIARIGFGKFLEGRGFSLTGGGSWRPSPHFNIKLEYTRRRINTGFGNPLLPPESLLPMVPVGPATCTTAGYAPFCTGDTELIRIFSGRVEINISPNATWNTLIQYENESENLGINSRFRWIVEPGREIFLTLNQGLIYDGSRDELHRAVTEPRAKISWLYRF